MQKFCPRTQHPFQNTPDKGIYIYLSTWCTKFLHMAVYLYIYISIICSVHKNDNGEQYLFRTKVIITNDGTMSWFSPNKLTTSCTIDIKYFPFDTQHCTMTFGSWSFTGNKLRLHFLNNQSQRIDLSNYAKNAELDILSAEGKLNRIVYKCCPDSYFDITYTLVMKRRPLFYINNLILPCIVLALLTGVSFLFPPETGERIALVVTVLLGMTVFMIVFTDFIPANSDVTPLIGKYFITVLFEVAACLLATCVPLRLQHLHPGTEMPYWAKVVIFDYLAVVLCFRCRRPKKVDDNKLFTVKNVNGHTNKAVDHKLCVQDMEKEETEENGFQNTVKKHAKDDPENGILYDGVMTVKTYIDKIEREGELTAEWKDAIAIIDRLFFWLFVVTFTISSTAILLPSQD